MQRYVFTDTNLFEQFQPIENIDWLLLTGSDSVTLVVPTVTISELNKHKDGGTHGRLKRRAARALSQLTQYSRQAEPPMLRAGVELVFRQQEPIIDFAAHHLSREMPDDRLLASAIEFAGENNIRDGSVMVATGDLGLELKTKAQRLLAPLPLPPELRLADELDAEERRTRELEDELRMYRAAVPNLELAFRNSSRFTKVQIERPKAHELGSPEDVVRDLEGQYPYLAPEPGHPQNGRFVFCNVGPYYCQQYNDALNQFFQRTGHWVRESAAAANWYRQSALLDLSLSNDGGAPGTDIDLEMNFPSNVEIVAPGQMPKIPAEPVLPLRPNDNSRTVLPVPQPSVPERFRIESISLDGKSRISRMEDTSDGTLVIVHLNNLKHTYEADIPRLLMHFESYEEAGSFRFRYRIVAANHPKPTEGSLDVIVEKK